ncbi:hypothetical protein, partial [Actinomadura bangladeshensis]
GVAAAEGDGERAALLLGVAKALRGIQVVGDADAERVAADARRLLGDAAYERAFAEGAALPLDQAHSLLTDPAAPTEPSR